MNKKVLTTTIITSILILCPLIAMLIFRYNFQHEGRRFLSVALPIFWLIINVLGAIGSNKKKENEKISIMSMWMLAAVSLITSLALYTMSFDFNLSMHTIFPLFSGAIFLLFGNYMPKLAVSKEKMSVMSIVMPWLYATINKDKDCSIQTNRFAAKIWVLGGIGLTLTIFLQSIAFLYVGAVLIIAMFVIPTIYACVKFKNYPKLQEVEK